MIKYIKKLKGIISIKLIFNLLYIIPVAMMPMMIKKLFDYNFSDGSKGIIILILNYFALVIVSMICQYITQLFSWKLENKFNILVKKDIFDSILNYDYKKFSEEDVSHYVSILNNDVGVAFSSVENTVNIIQTIIEVIVYGYFMFRLDLRIAFVAVLCSAVTLFLPNFTEKTLSERKKYHLDSIAMYFSKVTDLLGGFKNVNYETKKNISNEHNKVLNDTEDKLLHFGRFNTFTNVFNGFFMYLLLDITSFITVAVLLLKNSITLGTASAGLAYIKEFLYPVRFIIS